MHPSSSLGGRTIVGRNCNLLLDPAGDGARLSIELRRVRFSSGAPFSAERILAKFSGV